MIDFDPMEELARAQVLPEWIDGNGHMNVAYYMLAFDHALDRFCEAAEIGWRGAAERGESIFVLESHATYQSEVRQGDPLRFTLQLLEVDEKRLRYFMRMYDLAQQKLAATLEQIALHVSLHSRRATPMPANSQAMLQELLRRHRLLPDPPEAGVGITWRQREKSG